MQIDAGKQDNLIHTLRDIAYRQRQGILHVIHAKGEVDIHFHKGKIIEAVENRIHPVKDLAERMNAAGLISSDLPEGWDESYQTFYVALCEKQEGSRVIEEKRFKRFISHRILDKLYRCLQSEILEFKFEVKIVEFDKSLSPQISVGQLLLDVMALNSDAHRFGEVFSPDSVVQSLPSDRPLNLSPEHALIYKLCKKKGVTVRDLKQRSMLSYYHLQDGLLSLYERGLISSDRQPQQAENSADGAEEVLEDSGADSQGDTVFSEIEQSLSRLDSQIISRKVLSDMEKSAHSISVGAEELKTKDDARQSHVAKQLVTEAKVFERRSLEKREDFDREADDIPSASSESIVEILGIGPQSYQILNSPWVVSTMIFLFLFFAIFLPYFAWFEAVGYFAY